MKMNIKDNFVEKTFNSYSSKLGDLLFPEQTFFEIEARSFVSELLTIHNGNIESPQQFLTLLDTFVPEIVQHFIDNPSWATEKEVSRWENMTKEMIRQRIVQRFTAEFDNDLCMHPFDVSPKLSFLTGDRDIWLDSPEQITPLTHLAGAGVGVNKTQMHIKSFIENVRKLIGKNDG